jgi:hypothetical protein
LSYYNKCKVPQFLDEETDLREVIEHIQGCRGVDFILGLLDSGDLTIEQ